MCPQAFRQGIEFDPMIRCVVAHSHVLLRQGLRRLLDDEADIEVVAETGNEAETLQRVLEHKPDVVLIGANIFGLPDAERLILKESPQSKVFFLGTYELPDSTIPDSGAAAASSAPFNTSIEELVEKIRSICQSKKFEVRSMPRRGRGLWNASEAFVPRNRDLTIREREVLKLLAEGKTVRSAAEMLGLSVKTVDAHKFNLMRKLGIHNKAELVMCAIRRNIIKIPANF